MSEPTVLIRPSVVALAAAACLMTAACQRQQAPAAPAPEAVTPDPPVVIVAPPPVMNRAALLEAVAQAASDYAEGRSGTDVAAENSLGGRRFLIRQAFGCQVPVDPAQTPVTDGTGSLTRAEGEQDLKLTLTPIDWTPALATAKGTDAWEAAEGFWLSWPWLRAETCPRPPVELTSDYETAPAPMRATPPSVGLAAVFETNSSRLDRRKGRAYEFILRGEGQAAAVPDPGGYRVVMEGRLATFGDGRAIRCRASGPDERPVCVAAVRLERVAFETATGQTLSEWRS
ncbi:hypothetical protein [Brevundimonas vesicularis]|uniref:hypothetical protein n=1 Tax=Brevundimonas vesicularis TaxID=41276 RepID=UPI0038D4381B